MRITEGFKPTELPRLCQLNDTCFEGLERPPHQDFKNMLSITDHWFARLELWDANSQLIPSDAYSEIIGYILVDRRYGAYLWSVAVDPDHRGKGVAGYLLSRAEQFCKSKGDDSMRLHCHAANPSQKLYFDHGYRVYDLAHGYYGDGSIGLMMKKGL